MAAVLWLIDRQDVRGPVNLASPYPLPNRDFMAQLREAWGARTGLRSPTWLLEIGSAIIRTESELILKSRRVVPGILSRGGFEFEFSEWRDAAADLCRRWRALHQRDHNDAGD